MVYPEPQSKFLLKTSCASAISAAYAIHRGYYGMALVPGGVFITSLNYWRNPRYDSWERTLDITYVHGALAYQLFRAYGAQYATLHYITIAISVACYLLSNRYLRTDQIWLSTYLHAMLHIIANIACIILYSGHIPPSFKNRPTPGPTPEF